MWDKLPSVMLAKVAESIALRKAFPHELSGLYSPEEMDQADDDHRPAAEPAKSSKPAEWTVGDITARWQGAKVESADALAKGVQWLDQELTRLVPGYAHLDLEEGMYAHMGWGDETDLKSFGQSDLAAAKAFVLDYLTRLAK
jgi:hypothetical protein